MKLFRSKKARLITILATNVAVLSVALVISTVSWFSASVPIEPEENIPSSILSRYFDMNNGVDETQYAHGTAQNPYVITRPVHYYNLVRLHELGTYGFDENTYFQFGKTNLEGINNTQPMFYSYSDSGVIDNGVPTPYLNMRYYSNDLALAPIGSARHPFEGHIEGNNLTVRNLHIKGGGYSDVGIFGYVASHAVINNLYFDSPNIDAANASAVAPSSLGHATHDSHIYIGFLAGHVYNPSVFTHVYLNNCHLCNTVVNGYEMINTYGYFGHTDEPLASTADSSSYKSELNAANAYNAVQYTYENGRTQQLARRYTDEIASGTFSGAVSKNGSTYTIGQKSAGKPYSLSSIGYSSGNHGTERYVRYIKTEGGVDTLKEINNVEPENILTDRPVDPTYGTFGGYNDGAYIYWDGTNNVWKYAEVIGDQTKPINGDVSLNCFTISYEQTVSGVTKKYYLQYKTKGNGENYDTLKPHEWTSNDVPTTADYYFCFKTTFGHTGVSRFTECSGEQDYYIYSPYGKKYLCTYSPQNVYSSAPYLNANLIHTPVFVTEDGKNGYSPEKSGHAPLKFTIGGPITYITYNALENSNGGTSRNVNNDFDNNNSTTISKGALQGSNLDNAFELFGGHKVTAQCPGGKFTIGEYISNQTTTLTNAVNFRLTSNSSEITDGSTLIIAGFDGEQETTSSVDYAMGIQTNNNRKAERVLEVRDGNNYVLNETTGLAKMTFHNVGNNQFTLFADGYLYTLDSANRLRTKDIDASPDDSCKWKFVPIVQTGVYTRYRFQNVQYPNRYLCFNNTRSGTGLLFNCYNLENAADLTDPDDPENVHLDENNNRVDNQHKWFYIYKQQTGQTISNVHYTTAVSFDIQAPVYPYKDFTEYNLKSAAINSVPTQISAYSDFTVNPQYNVSFDTVQSQVHYFDTLIETWKRVNIISELKEGDQVVISANTSGTTHYFMSTTQNNNNRGRTSNVSFTPPYLAGGKLPNAAQRFTLKKSGNYWQFFTGQGYLYAASSSSDYLRTETNPDAYGNANFSISISLTANATIVAHGNNTHNKIQYYSSYWNGYFTCFTEQTTNRTAVQIYKLEQSTADQTTWVGDLINDFEPLRMDAVGPNIQYNSTYMHVNSTPAILSTPANGTTFYPSKYLQNTISILIDNNGSKDLGTLIFEYESTSTSPYFMPSNTSIISAGAVDTDTVANDNNHRYLLNINALNIDNLCWIYLKGEGTNDSPFTVCTSGDPDMSKYVILLGCATDINIKDIMYTFNAVPGNIGYSDTVDYRSATYDYNEATHTGTGTFTGSVAGGQQVNNSALSIYYDVTHTGQKVSISVTYSNGTYTVTIDSSGTVLTEDLVINIFKYDNNASTLIVVINDVPSDPIYTGTTSITIEAP